MDNTKETASKPTPTAPIKIRETRNAPADPAYGGSGYSLQERVRELPENSPIPPNAVIAASNIVPYDWRPINPEEVVTTSIQNGGRYRISSWPRGNSTVIGPPLLRPHS